jgi:hypothetical protein
MAEHTVEFAVPARPLGNNDIVFEVRGNGLKVGELKVSRGGVVWRPAGQRGTHVMRWGRFNKLMQEHGTPRAR